MDLLTTEMKQVLAMINFAWEDNSRGLISH